MKYKINYFINDQIQIGGNEQNKKIKKTEKELLLFKADWCGHCNNFLPIWEKLEQELSGGSNNIKFRVYDNDKHPDKFKAYDVNKFPSIFLKVGEDVYEYMSDRNLDIFHSLTFERCQVINNVNN
jgi:thiol-disulfide isomerase/thioredoxin